MGAGSDNLTVKEVPGTYGPPLLGVIRDTVDFFFISGWKEFFLKRQKKYASNVFKMHMMTKVIAVLDHDGFEPLFNWDGRLAKEYGFGWAVPPRPLVGDITPSIFEAGEAHDAPKRFYTELVKRRRSTLLQTSLDVSSEFCRRWSTIGSFSWSDEVEDYCASLVFQWFLGEHPATADVRYLYLSLFNHPAASIEKRLPWSNYSRSLQVFDRLLTFVRNSKRFGELAELAAVQGLNDLDMLAKQVLFLIGMNSFLGMQGLTKSLIGELSLRPKLRSKLIAEIDAELGRPIDGRLSLAAVAGLPLLDRFVKEVLRLHPPVFFIHGRATRDFPLKSKTGTYRISAGDMIMGAIWFAHQDPDIYHDPETFDPDRFLDPSSTRYLIWPHGTHEAPIDAHSRICPGRDVAVLAAKLFCVTLLAGYRWELAAPPRWSTTTFGLNVASPEGPLTVASFGPRGA